MKNFAQICLGILCGSLAFGQVSLARKSFEAASIRPLPSDVFFEQLIAAGRVHIRMDDSQVDLGAIRLSQLIQSAYRVPQRQVIAPDWLGGALFDVNAKIPHGATRDDVPEMMQTLLAERFKLALHHEQRMVPIYELRVAKDGPKFQQSKYDDSVTTIGRGGASRVWHKVTMEQLASSLTPFNPNAAAMNPGLIDRPIVDMTGLKGTWDFTMDYSPSSDTDTAAAAVKALGLRLDPAQRPYDYIIVDHIEKAPTEN